MPFSESGDLINRFIKTENLKEKGAAETKGKLLDKNIG
jgi:hypothetical protein